MSCFRAIAHAVFDWLGEDNSVHSRETCFLNLFVDSFLASMIIIDGSDMAPSVAYRLDVSHNSYIEGSERKLFAVN